MLDLSNPTAKVTWAGHHLEKLRLEYRRVIIDEPHFAVPELDAEHAEYVFRYQEPTRDLESLGLIIGDVVHNLRSALDYIAWQLSESNGIIPLLNARGVREPERIIMYPLADSPSGFENAKKRWIGLLPDPLQQIIESTQPYKSGYEMLAMLHRLAISDKHRVIAVIAQRYGGFHFIGKAATRGDFPSPEDWHSYTMRSGTGPVKAGEIIMRVPLAVYAANMEREPQLAFTVELADAKGLDSRDPYTVMHALHEVVRERAIPKFG